MATTIQCQTHDESLAPPTCRECTRERLEAIASLRKALLIITQELQAASARKITTREWSNVDELVVSLHKTALDALNADRSNYKPPRNHLVAAFTGELSG